MNATCAVETGLLRKKPCGHVAVTECDNCSQPLCSEHAVPQLTESGKRSGKFLCKECSLAIREHDKSVAAAARTVAQPKKPPVAPAAAPAAVTAAAAPVAQAAEPAKKDDSGALEFTPKDGKLTYERKKDEGSGN
jgi:hypothetical protein